MSRKNTLGAAVAAAVVLAGIVPAWAEDYGDGWEIKNKVDEEVRFREIVGLSKARTLGQSDIDKRVDGGAGLFSSIRFHSTLRVSYDAVYDINPHFGTDAGGQAYFRNNTGGANAAWGGGVPIVGAGIVGTAANPNSGLAMVDGWRKDSSGLLFATPVRPCDTDSRGCIRGYMDYTKDNLAAPEIDQRLDFLREAYVDGEVPVGNSTLAIRFGRQQLVWGRTDLFRVLDVVNPMDYSRNNIYDENSDIRIPMGMLRADYRMGARGPFDDLNFQGLWVWEKFRPNNLGQGGSTNNPGGAAGMFRALATCWQKGCTVGNFFPGTGPVGGGSNSSDGTALTFGPGEIGIRSAQMPDWNIANTTVGGKVEGEIKGIGFSLNALNTIDQMPSLKGGIPTINGLTGANSIAGYVPAFDIVFPRIQVYGGSADFTIEPIETAFRIESTYTAGELVADDAVPELARKTGIVRYVFGADRSTFIPFLNKNTAFLISGQLFGQHITNYDDRTTTTGGHMGMADWEDNWIATLLVKGWYAGQTISPQVIMAHDFKADANVIEPSVEWTPTANWRFRIGGNVKFGQDRQVFSTDADGVPWGNASAPNRWMSTQPFGDIRNGIIGQAAAETEMFVNATLRF